MRLIWEILWCVFVVAIVLLIATAATQSSAVCLTKSEARQLWPKKHLYWYSADHCWSNRRGGPPTGVKYDLIRENHAEEKSAESRQKKAEVVFPQVKQIIPWLDPKLYEAKASTLSHRLLDIDELTANNNPDPPECCWPELKPDGSLK